MTVKAAWATLLTKASYLPGLFVLHETLLQHKSKYPLVVMVTPQLEMEAREVVARRGLTIRNIDRLQPEDGVHSISELDARFGDTWTKLRCATWHTILCICSLTVSP